jgi:RNA polymerase sigma-70 factor, ECF subfamily
MAKGSTSIETPLHALPASTRSTDRVASTGRFEQLIMTHLDSAYNLARWLTRNDADAEDVVQEACLRAYKYFDAFQGERPSAWFLAIVRNACYTWIHFNRSSREVYGIEIDNMAVIESATLSEGGSRPLTADPETLLIERRERQSLNELIADLPQQYREVIVLREIEDLSYREIADIVGIPVGTVMSRLWRARKLLHESWSPTGEPELV